MAEWQPIETAPRDGTWVLLRGGTSEADDPSSRLPRGDAPPCVVAQWDPSHYEGGGYWWFALFDTFCTVEYMNPTHWMPLPAPPNVGSTQ